MLDSSADFSQKYFHPAKAVACWIDPMLEQVSKNAFSLRFGPLGWFSYPYYLFYEYLAPIIEVIGVVVTLLTLVINIINIPYTIVFFFVYFVFGIIMGISAFLARIYYQNVYLSRRDIFRAIVLAFVEVFFTQFVILSARISVLFLICKKKLEWGTIQRNGFGEER